MKQPLEYCSYNESTPNNYISDKLDFASKAIPFSSALISIPNFILGMSLDILDIKKENTIFTNNYLEFALHYAFSAFLVSSIANKLHIPLVGKTYISLSILNTLFQITQNEGLFNEDPLDLILDLHFTTSSIFTCPLGFTAKTIGFTVDKLKNLEIINLSYYKFPYIEETKFTAGGMAQAGFDRYPLHNAMAMNQKERAETLLNSVNDEVKIKALTESDTGDGGAQTILTLATLHGNIEMAKWIENKYNAFNIDINTQDHDGKTGLMVAAAKGHRDLFSYLLNKYQASQLNICEKDFEGNTALHYISATLLFSNLNEEQRADYIEIIRALVNNCDYVNDINSSGKTALDIATEKTSSSVKAQYMSENQERAIVMKTALSQESEPTKIVEFATKLHEGITEEISQDNIFEDVLNIVLDNEL